LALPGDWLLVEDESVRKDDRLGYRTKTFALLLLLAMAIQVVPALAQGDGTEGPEIAGLSEELLPGSRVLSFYGFPNNELMGILGEYEKNDLLAVLEEQAAEYEALDPSRPVKLAFEVIASVAQRDPGADNDYLEYADTDLIQEYVDFTAENGLLLLLDMQYGRNTTKQEIDKVRDFLKYPHVHLALDPEFHVREGETPGVDLGQIDAADVNDAQDELADISREAGIPPKILIVHQFNLYSITNKEQIEDVDGVQFVLEVDGWGPPDMKRETYAVVTGEVPFDFYGFKLWYQQDEPLMSPADVLALEPAPDVIIYQ
jgi:hypothetical protein